MDEIFLSASVPLIGRGDFYKTASPFLIQVAVREFLIAALGRRLVVWGGHPAITPMVWAVCNDLDVSYAASVTLYQSRLFEPDFPQENAHFKNVEYIDAVGDDRSRSLTQMREAMISRSGLVGAVFIGGMEGIFEEYELFRKFHPNAQILAVAGPGGAAREVAESRGEWTPTTKEDLNFARMFYESLGIEANEARQVLKSR